MIAEDRVDAERGAQARKLGCPGRRRHAFCNKGMRREIIAKHDDEIAAESITRIHHLAHATDAHVRSTGMQVGNDGNGEAAPFGPRWGRQAIVGDHQIPRRLRGGIGRLPAASIRRRLQVLRRP